MAYSQIAQKASAMLQGLVPRDPDEDKDFGIGLQGVFKLLGKLTREPDKDISIIKVSYTSLLPAVSASTACLEGHEKP